MQKNSAAQSAAEIAGSDRKPAGASAALGLLINSPYLERLRATVTQTYAALSSDQAEAVDAIEKTIASLARPEVPLDPAIKSEMIAKFGALLTKMERLHAMLPKGEMLALQSLDKAGALLKEMDKAG